MSKNPFSSHRQIAQFLHRHHRMVLSLCILVGALAVLLVQLQHVQNSKQKAAVPLTAPQLTVNVLAIGFNPVEGGKNIADTYFGASGTDRMGGRTAAQQEDYIFNNTIDAFRRLSAGTINYTIVHRMNITTFPRYTSGYIFTLDNYKECVWGTPAFNGQKCDQQKAAFDHTAWLTDNRLCELMDEKGADEVWVVSNPYIMQLESFMFGPKDGFWVNGGPFVMPTCKKNYVLMDATYDAADNFLESYGHRVESFMMYLTSAWKSEDRVKYWDNFASWNNRQDGDYPVPTCGNAHWPANAQFGYDFGNTRTIAFTCPDWKNFPDLKGETEVINCTAWGCDDKGWQEHWFGSLPKGSGSASMVSNIGTPFTISRNWWDYILYPENAIAQRKAQTTMPTPSVTPTFSNLTATLRGDVAAFSFAYNGFSSDYHIDMTQRADFSFGIYLSFAQGPQSPLTVINPQAKWDQYRCGNTMYWRVWNTNHSIQSPIQNATITCTTPTPTPFITFIPTPTQPGQTLTPTLRKEDINKDGRIDLLDFNLWRDEFLGNVTTKQADINTDGLVDLIDFNLWLQAYRLGV